MIEEINEIKEIELFSNEWLDLLMQDSDIDICFLYPEWFNCWWQSFGGKKQKLSILLWYTAKLSGVFPLFTFNDYYKGIPYRRLSFLENPNSPVVDFIVKTKDKIFAIPELISFLFHKKDWDIFILNKIDKDNVSFSILKKFLKSNKIPFFIRLIHNSPYIEISKSWDEFWKETSQRFKKRIRNNFNRLFKAGNIKFEEVNNILGNDLPLRQAFQVSSNSWKAKLGTAMNSSPQRQTFFTNLSKIASQKGWLSIWLLKIDDVPAAMEYHLKHRGVTYAMRGDYDENYKKFSPGACLEAYIIQECFKKELKRYDFCGLDYDYKLHWTHKSKAKMRFIIYNKTPRGFLLYHIHKLNFRIKKIKNKKWK